MASASLVAPVSMTIGARIPRRRRIRQTSRPSPSGSPTSSRMRSKLSLARRAMASAAGEAYVRLLGEIAPYLRSLAARCLNEAADIEDVVQDTLLTLHAVRRTYDPRRPFGPWLVAIARRRLVDRLRQRSRRSALVAALD